MRLVLFDIDGTLLLTGGAGSRALGKTMDRIYGIQGSMQGIKPNGKTDPAIVAEALARYKIEVSENELEQIFEQYVAVLEAELKSPSNVQVLPGVHALLSRLADDPGIRVGVATGNVEAGAQLKLQFAGLLESFAFGGFGSDARDRTEMIRTAIRRGQQLDGDNTVEAVILFGDTPRDIKHGRRAGARTIAVATGSYTAQQLSPHEPSLLLENLDSIEPILELIRS